MSVENHKQENILNDFFKVDRHTLTVNGKDQTLLNFKRGDSVGLLVFNRTKSEWLLTRQFRLSAWLKEGKDSLLEIVAGKIDAGETPEQAAKRECVEEIGYSPKSLDFLVSYYPSCGGSDEIIHIFYAEVEEKDKVSSGGGRLEENEFIELLRVPHDKLYTLFRGHGDVVDSKLLAAISMLFVLKTL